MKNRKTSCTIDSPVGPLVLAATEGGLTHLLFGHRVQALPEGDGSPEAAAVLDRARDQLAEYFAGTRRAFELPLAPSGTEFQRDVWRALCDIGYGETASYAELAARIGRPKAVRAVGAANGKNPISIVVPCHRVIGADGSLTGYGGGLQTKRRLLEIEGCTPRQAPPSQLSLLAGREDPT